MSCTNCAIASIGRTRIYSFRDRESQETWLFLPAKGYDLARKNKVEIVTLTEEEIASVLQFQEIDPEHMSHMGGFTARPGLIGTVSAGTHLLIDGSHRAAYCWRYQIPFSAYLLDTELTDQTRIGTITGFRSP